ncbi:MAG: hypothetical protein COA57_04120 [Flavobacteriales bacterium]|nr:DUF1330 domain-containing protein [Bacteroidales bacterium AH-315-I05]PCJ87864.1 MAG: hypothetical protein COA57_04120 [Flavobacteriales bacterium]
MKNNVIIAALMLTTLSMSAASCSSNNANNVPKNTSTGTMAKTEVDNITTLAAAEVIFQKGKLIEVAFLSVKGGKEKQLNEEYFPKVMPIVTEYGGKPLLTIGVQHAWSEEIKPQMVVFFEWPSAAKKEAFEKDKRFKEVKKIRDDALSFLKLSFFEVEQDLPVQLDKSKFYEVYGMSMDKENGHLMQKYFEKAGPICVNDYSVDFALSMKPVPVSISGSEHYVPQTFGLAIWPSADANAKYFGSKEYAEIKHFKEDALERMDAWQGSVILKQ